MKTTLLLPLLLFTFAASAQVHFTYHWRQIAGPVSVQIDNPDSAATWVRELNAPGEYRFEFEVCNEFGCGYDTCTVTVLPSDVLALDTTTRTRITRPIIKKLEIKSLIRGSEILFEIKSPRVQSLNVQIYDATGRLLGRSVVNVRTGYNYVSLPAPRVHGVYYIRVISYFENVTRKIMI